MTGTVLILGANGRFGRNAAEAFWNAGWRVSLFDRSKDDLTTAAQGQDVIVSAWNPLYPDWGAQVPKLTEQVIAAAESSGATVIIPGNVYVYGPDAPDRFAADTPHAARNPLGQVRIKMEESFRASGVQTIILRAGDFLDTEASGNWFDKIMAPSLKKGVFTYPGAPDLPHGWAFLPDLARATVALAEQREFLPRFSDIPFAGYTLSGQDMAQLCAEALGKPVRLKKMSWLPIQIARPFWPLAKHLVEMSYLWNKPHHLDGQVFDELVPDFPVTPPSEAIAQALRPFNPTAGPSRQGDAARPLAPAA